MVHRGGLQAPVEADVVHAVGKVAQFGVDLDPQLAGAAELERAAHEVALASVHARLELVALLDELRQVEVDQLGLRIECVDMARSALHQQEDATLGLGHMVARPRGQFARLGAVLVQQPRECDGTEPHAGVVQQLAPGWTSSEDSAFHAQYT